MIDFYTWTTPNSRKVSIMLEECGLPYETHLVDIGKNEQFTAEFKRWSPNSKVPAIIDRDHGLSVFESGAILIYLAEKTGTFLPTTQPGRAKTIEWLMWQMAGVGPMMGQANYFANTMTERVPIAIDRFLTESARLIRVLDDRLAQTAFVADDYSIADMALFPWMTVGFGLLKGMKPEIVGEGTHVARWLTAVGARPAVVRGMAVPKV